MIRQIFSRVNDLIYKYFSAQANKPVWYDENDQASIRKQLILEGYFSQAGQDKWLLENFFAGKSDGFFVDIGAHDGVSINNTYRLERDGWQGIAIEANPSIYPLLRKNRKCITENCAVAAFSGIGKFRMIYGHAEMLSGLISEYDPRHLKRIAKEVGEYGGNYSDISIECRTLNEILETHKISHIDYLSIDIEGSEYNLLRSIDFDKFTINVISVENNYHDWKIPYLLKGKGFRLHSIVSDEIYINQNLSHISSPSRYP